MSGFAGAGGSGARGSGLAVGGTCVALRRPVAWRRVVRGRLRRRAAGERVRPQQRAPAGGGHRQHAIEPT